MIDQYGALTLEAPSAGPSMVVHSVGRLGRLRWIWPAMARMATGRRPLEGEPRPFKVRWGWALLIALALLLLIADLGPAAATIVALP